MPQTRTLLLQPKIFSRLDGGIGDLLKLKPQEIFPFSTLGNLRSDRLQLGESIPPDFVRGLIVSSKGMEVSESIHRI
jgi:hypothetical protein